MSAIAVNDLLIDPISNSVSGVARTFALMSL